MHVHVLRRHLDLVLAEREQTTKGDVRVRDVVLPGRQLLQVVSFLQDRAVVRRDVQAIQTMTSEGTWQATSRGDSQECYNVVPLGAISQAALHSDFVHPVRARLA